MHSKQWASPCGSNGPMTMALHSYRFRQFQITWNRDMRSGPWATLYGSDGPMPVTLLHNYTARQLHRILNGENPSRGFKDIHLSYRQVHMGQMDNNGWACIGQMDKCSWRCTTTSRDFGRKKSIQPFQWCAFMPLAKPKWVKWASYHNTAQLQI